MRPRSLFSCFLFATAIAACGGDDGDATDPDAAPQADGAPDPDADTALEAPSVHMRPLSATGSDAFFGVAFAADGKFYAAGYRADGVESTSDRAFVLARFLPSGELDTSFGDDGVATKNVVVGGNGEAARGIAVQSDGKIVIAGQIEHDPEATGTALADRDIAIVRFDAAGVVDPTFGLEGVLVLDLGTGVETIGSNGPTLSSPDNLWNIALGPDDTLFLHGNTRTPAALDDPERTDNDWVTVRLTADGELDTSFSDDGVFTLDLQEASGNARSVTVLANGNTVSAGYSNTPGLGSTQAVLYQLDPDGELVAGFGNGGVFHEAVLADTTEAYGVVEVAGKLITTGYGRATAEDDLDWVSLRLTAEGDLDTTWGEGGAVVVDHAGFGDNCRAIVALPEDRILLIGGGRASEDENDGAIAVLDGAGAGAGVAAFGEGGRARFDLGGVGDMFWAGAAAPDGSFAVAVGHKGAGSSPTTESNDDAAVLIVPLE